jgi:twinkle protein
MLDKTTNYGVSADRYGQPGYHALSEIPQQGSVAEIAVGCGWPDMNEFWRIYPGQFTMVTGVAGHGKSTFLQNVVVNVARDPGLRTFMFVPENEGHIYEKMKLIWGNQPGFEDFADDYCFIQSARPEHYNSTPKTLDWVLDRAIVSIEQDGANIVLIDPWNELERAKAKDQLLTDYIGECLMKMKQFCRSRNVAVILVAHPTKAGVGEGKTPTLSDIEGSMNWNNKADAGLIVVRELTGNTTKVISAKVREIGAGKRGQCFFHVEESTGLFTPLHGSASP